MFTIKQIKTATNAEVFNCKESHVVKDICTDTRMIKKNDIFIALKGRNFNGHDFVNEAFKKGAGAAVVSRIPNPGYAPVLKVKDTSRALSDIAAFHRKRISAKIIAVTGSNGKTTTKDMIAHILSKKHKVKSTKNTENNMIGVPLTLLGIRNQKYAVIEIGTNSFGEIAHNAGILKPHIGIITNIGPSHLAGLKNLKNILKEKSSLIDYIRKNGCIITGKDDPLLSNLKTGIKKITFGIQNKDCNFFASGIKNKNFKTEFLLNGKYKFEIFAFGMHNVYNALGSIAACVSLGKSIRFCREGLSDFKPTNMRFNIHRMNGICIIDDAYNSNPLSMKAAISTLKTMKTKGRKIVAAADMLELGKNSKNLHFDTGYEAAKSGIDMLVTIGELSKNMNKGAAYWGMSKTNLKNFNNNDQAAEFLINAVKPNDIVLIKGSRSMKMEEILKCFTTSYTH